MLQPFQSLVPDHITSEAGKAERYILPAINQILAAIIQTGGNTLCSAIYKLINSIWNKTSNHKQKKFSASTLSFMCASPFVKCTIKLHLCIAKEVNHNFSSRKMSTISQMVQCTYAVNAERQTYPNHFFRFITQWFAMPVFLIFYGGEVLSFVCFCNDSSWFYFCRRCFMEGL
jgi:hypothetical protein